MSIRWINIINSYWWLHLIISLTTFDSSVELFCKVYLLNFLSFLIQSSIIKLWKIRKDMKRCVSIISINGTPHWFIVIIEIIIKGCFWEPILTLVYDFFLTLMELSSCSLKLCPIHRGLFKMFYSIFQYLLLFNQLC